NHRTPKNRCRDRRRAGRFLRLELGASLELGIWNLELVASALGCSQIENRHNRWPAQALIEFQTFLLHAGPMSGLIAIVGRPNVGKSALFNRIAGRRIAIVHDRPGVTRDRVSAEAEWHGRPFTLVDTGGIGLLRREKATDEIQQAALDQVQIAIESAQVIILVVDVHEGVVPLDREVAGRLRRCGKPVVVAANKADNSNGEAGAADFAGLGFDEIFPVSAIHDRGIEALMKTAVDLLPPTGPLAGSPLSVAEVRRADATDSQQLATDQPLKLAIVGRPNVGKSSLINALTQSERVIVSPIPGTTRDSV